MSLGAIQTESLRHDPAPDFGRSPWLVICGSAADDTSLHELVKLAILRKLPR